MLALSVSPHTPLARGRQSDTGNHIQSADQTVRERRKKCIPGPTGSCYLCLKRGIPCTLEGPPGGVSTWALRTDRYQLLHECRDGEGFRISPSLFIDDDLAEELVSLYFNYVHVAFHNIFHQPSVEAALRTGTLPTVLLMFLASLSARFSTHSSLAEIPIRERGMPYWTEAEKLIDFYSTSLLTIQACIMAAAYLSIEGDPNAESVFLSVACRMALIMDLPNSEVQTRLEQDLRLRGEYPAKQCKHTWADRTR